MKKALFLVPAIFLLFIPYLFAEISLSCEVDKKNITTDEVLTYKLIVSSTEEDAPAPRPPSFRGFSVLSQAQSSTFIFSQDKIKSLTVYTYVLSPLRPGQYTIEPSMLALKDKTLNSEAIEIEVTPGGKEQANPLPEEGLPEPEGPKITL